MSRQNVELLREAYKAFQPDQLRGGQGVYHGRQEFARGVDELTDTFDDSM